MRRMDRGTLRDFCFARGNYRSDTRSGSSCLRCVTCSLYLEWTHARSICTFYVRDEVRFGGRKREEAKCGRDTPGRLGPRAFSFASINFTRKPIVLYFITTSFQIPDPVSSHLLIMRKKTMRGDNLIISNPKFITIHT